MQSVKDNWEDVTEEVKELSLEPVSQVETFEFRFDAPSYITPEFISSTQPNSSIPQEPPKKQVSETLEPATKSVKSEQKLKNTKKNEENEQGRINQTKEGLDKKESLNIVFIGHVDAGKSTIGGHLLYLTGQVDKRTLEKYEREAKEKNRESWYLSWALDTNQEERDKGKTVEVGKAFFETETKRIVLLDAPGHKGYVPNMISGTAQADIAILVISARKGEFETGFEKGGQTREHALIAKIAGVRMLIVLVNKMDDPTVVWSNERYVDIEARLTVFLKKIGWKSNEITFMPVSGFAGSNLKDPLTPNVCPWWTNKPSFLQLIDNMDPLNQDLDTPPMIMISDRYKDMGTVVIGKVIAGCFSKGDSFVLMPSSKPVKIMNIISIDDSEKQTSKVGDNIRVRVSGIEEEEVHPGFVLCNPNSPCGVADTFDAQLIILECKSLLAKGYKAVIHLHNAVDEAEIKLIKCIIDRKSGDVAQKSPKFVKQDQICVVTLKLSNVVCISPFTVLSSLGRFTLRDEGRTVAFGKVLSVKN